MQLAELMTLLAQEFGLEELVPDENGTYALTAGGIDLTVAPATATSAILYATLGSLSVRDSRELSQTLLRQNYHFAGTQGATFAADPETGCPCLQRLLPIGQMDFEEFVEAFSAFADTAVDWRRQIGQTTTEDPASRPQEELPPAGLGGIPDTWLSI